MIVRIGAISLDSSLSIRGVMLSGPVALCGFRLLSSFYTSLVVMLKSGIVGYFPYVVHNYGVT
jgi:hypothetical protein